MYKPKATPKEISAVSRVAVKVKDNYYTIESSETRTINPESEDVNMKEEFNALFDEVNSITDAQTTEIIETFK